MQLQPSAKNRCWPALARTSQRELTEAPVDCLLSSRLREDIPFSSITYHHDTVGISGQMSLIIQWCPYLDMAGDAPVSSCHHRLWPFPTSVGGMSKTVRHRCLSFVMCGCAAFIALYSSVHCVIQCIFFIFYWFSPTDMCLCDVLLQTTLFSHDMSVESPLNLHYLYTFINFLQHDATHMHG